MKKEIGRERKSSIFYDVTYVLTYDLFSIFESSGCEFHFLIFLLNRIVLA